MSESNGYAENLNGVLERLLSNERYNPIVREIAQELHDGFEIILCQSITANPGEQIDGRAILAILMTWTREIQTSPDTQQRSPVPPGLPSQKYATRNDGPSSAPF